MARGKRSASWMKTNTTWEVRKAVWLRWSLGDSADKTLDFLSGNTVQFPDAPVDRGTIAKIRDELLLLPLDLVRLLIKELPDTGIRSFVLEKRPDLCGKLEEEELSQPIHSSNWVVKYEAEQGRLPVLPQPLQALVGHSNQPVRKDMVVGIASMQLWRGIKDVPGLERKWREFLEWKGEDPDEYEYKVNSLRPPKGNPHPLTWKHPRRP
jgi:hypothetical protein